MKAFSALLDGLVFTPSRNAKLSKLVNYFRNAPDPDRGWALAALADGFSGSRPVRRILRELMQDRVDPELYQLSRDYVGDTAETVALLWPETGNEPAPPRLADVIATMESTEARHLPYHLQKWLDNLDPNGRWALLKLLTGGLRVGVSARLAKTSLANAFDKPIEEIEELWHGLEPPYLDLFAWLEDRAQRPNIDHVPVFRPLMLANPLEDKDLEGLQVSEFSAEWKWDGIRVQISTRAGVCKIFSRTGDDVSAAFPDIAQCYTADAVLDGELLVVRDGTVAPFNDLQQRLNRKAVSKKMLDQFPAHVRLYDLLIDGSEDLRQQPFLTRRLRLEKWMDLHAPERADLSETLTFSDKDELKQQWEETRGIGIEGLMLKRSDSAYLQGRPKGHWYKWKRAPLTVDVVLMYAQRGSGKRSSFYSDFTFGAWRETESETVELVPVGKAYSGYTDQELLDLDKWIRRNTVDRFGPVRSVKPEVVFEVAFDAVHRSTRHKSGVAMRFPRIHRIRWDKPAEEADRLPTLIDMID